MKEYFSSPGEPVSNVEIEHLINEYKLVLPLEYIDFIKEVNGGKTKNISFELAKFDIQKKRLDYYIDIDFFFSLESLSKVWTYTEDDLRDYNLFPIAEVRGGAIICCLQDASMYAKIYFYEASSGMTKLTESLDDFLNLLIPESEVDFKKYGIDY
jgi:hypothetical protein